MWFTSYWPYGKVETRNEPKKQRQTRSSCIEKKNENISIAKYFSGISDRFYTNSVSMNKRWVVRGNESRDLSKLESAIFLSFPFSVFLCPRGWWVFWRHSENIQRLAEWRRFLWCSHRATRDSNNFRSYIERTGRGLTILKQCDLTDTPTTLN